MPHMSTKSGEPRAWLEGKRFHDSVDCLNWPFTARAGGYGMMALGNTGHFVTASRVMCGIAHGPAPSPIHQTAHSCGNPLCVNPRHLRWATPAENVADCVIHGTDGSGEKNRSAKLNASQVEDVRAKRRAGRSLQSLAAEFGIARPNIGRIVTGKSWQEGRKLRVVDKLAHQRHVRAIQADRSK